MRARYVHTNLIARDWRALAGFYQRVFGCEPVGPERELGGEWLASGTGVPGARLRGRHLRLPGHGERGPTLEIFEYAEVLPGCGPAANRAGFGHLAFEVEQVAEAVRSVVAAGGAEHGAVVTHEVAGVGVLTFAYVRDPEGNLIELQAWS